MVSFEQNIWKILYLTERFLDIISLNTALLIQNTPNIHQSVTT